MADDAGLATSQKRVGKLTSVKHFGVTLRASKYSHRLKRHEYALPNKTKYDLASPEMYTEEHWAALGWMYEDAIYSDEFCKLQHEAALENFDMHKAFFRHHCSNDFLDRLEQASCELRLSVC